MNTACGRARLFDPVVCASNLQLDVQGSTSSGEVIYDYGVSDPDVMYGRTGVSLAFPLLRSIVQDPQLIG